MEGEVYALGQNPDTKVFDFEIKGANAGRVNLEVSRHAGTSGLPRSKETKVAQ